MSLEGEHKKKDKKKDKKEHKEKDKEKRKSEQEKSGGSDSDSEEKGGGSDSEEDGDKLTTFTAAELGIIRRQVKEYSATRPVGSMPGNVNEWKESIGGFLGFFLSFFLTYFVFHLNKEVYFFTSFVADTDGIENFSDRLKLIENLKEFRTIILDESSLPQDIQAARSSSDIEGDIEADNLDLTGFATDAAAIRSEMENSVSTCAELAHKVYPYHGRHLNYSHFILYILTFSLYHGSADSFISCYVKATRFYGKPCR